jgi:putative transposase
MVLYRRNRVTGGTYFFTVTLRDRSSDILVRQIHLLRDAFRLVRAQRTFMIDAVVILPDHLHTIWTLPEGDTDYSGRWRTIKSHFTHTLHATGVRLRPYVESIVRPYGCSIAGRIYDSNPPTFVSRR